MSNALNKNYPTLANITGLRIKTQYNDRLYWNTIEKRKLIWIIEKFVFGY